MLPLTGSSARRARRNHARHVLEEELDRHVEHARQIVQPARPNPVRSVFVLLHLLEGEPNGIT